MLLYVRTQIGMFRPIRMDHTNCLQVAIKTLQFNMSITSVFMSDMCCYMLNVCYMLYVGYVIYLIYVKC
jgi:hypothetical protein